MADSPVDLDPSADLEPIAIVGMGGLFPGARSLDQFWTNLRDGVDSGRHAPEGRWSLPAPWALDKIGVPDKTYSDWGCFLDPFEFRAEGRRLKAATWRRLDPVFQIGMMAAEEAWADARQPQFAPPRAGIILGNLALPTESINGLSRMVLGRGWAEQVLPDLAHELFNAPDWHPLNRSGLGLPAAIIARELGFGGQAFTVDAACASSLYALHYAMDELRSGRADVMIAGGMSRPDCQYTQTGFAQLKALSKKKRCTPLDADADGLVVGEGAAAFVLRRLSDALADGSPIHGLLRGSAVSNDRGGNLMAPHSEGQLRAMRSAYQRVGWCPSSVDLIECHATGTPVGDWIELESLITLWGDAKRDGRCVLGSVKSNIGHLLTGAGAASLMKVLLALKHKTLPPTANFQQPSRLLAEGGAPFEVLAESKPWTAPPENRARRAAVNSFGFGGINAHVLVEEWTGSPAQKAMAHAPLVRPMSSVACSIDGKPIVSNGACPTTALPGGDSSTMGEPIAVIGLATRYGVSMDRQDFAERTLGHRDVSPLTPPQHADLMSQATRGLGTPDAPGASTISTIDLPVGWYRIPPVEQVEFMPQQALMLQVADQALADAGQSRTLGERGGVFIGLALDPNASNFQLRWCLEAGLRSLEQQDSSNGEDSGNNARADERSREIARLKDLLHQPLTPHRVMGHLGGIVASRLAREFDCGGPSFVLSSEETGGLTAIERALRSLQLGEIDIAIAGAVDLAADARIAALRRTSKWEAADLGLPDPDGTESDAPSHSFEHDNAALPPLTDGCGAAILKRLSDAVAAGDRILAVISDVVVRTLPGPTPSPGAEVTGVAKTRIDDTAPNCPIASEPVTPLLATLPAASRKIGHAGAASGFAEFAQGVLALTHRVLPAGSRLRDVKTVRSQYWLHDVAQGPRQVDISATSNGGVCTTLRLGEHLTAECTLAPRLESLIPSSLFLVSGHDRATLRGSIEQLRHLLDSPDPLLVPAVLPNGKGKKADATSPHAPAVPILDELQSIHRLAQRWWHAVFTPESSAAIAEELQARPEAVLHGGALDRPRAAIVVASHEELREQLDHLESLLNSGGTSHGPHLFFRGLELPNDALPSKLAFVFPGSGNQFLGMGRELAAAFPHILDRQQQENFHLRSQYAPDIVWNGRSTAAIAADHRVMIFGQVALATLGCDLLESFGIRPDVAIGNSLGESASLFGLRVWTTRDEMYDRVVNSKLFAGQLTAPFEAVAKLWSRDPQRGPLFTAGIIDLPPEAVWSRISQSQHVFLLIVTTPKQCVIGGHPDEVAAVVKDLGATWRELSAPSAVHCPVVREVEADWRALHELPVSPQSGIAFVSGATTKPYPLTTERCAEAVTAQALSTIDFPAIIRQALQDGVTTFLEIGPGNSCTRMINEILGRDVKHVWAAIPVVSDAATHWLRTLGWLAAQGFAIDLHALYGEPPAVPATQPVLHVPVRRLVRGGLPVGPDPAQKLWHAPERPDEVQAAAVIESPAPRDDLPITAIPTEDISPAEPWDVSSDQEVVSDGTAADHSVAWEPVAAVATLSAPASLAAAETSTVLNLHEPLSLPSSEFLAMHPEVFRQWRAAVDDLQAAHEAYLKFAARTESLMARGVEAQLHAASASPISVRNGATRTPVVRPEVRSNPVEDRSVPSNGAWRPSVAAIMPPPVERKGSVPWTSQEPPRSLDREACMEFAIGEIGRALGPMFAAIDANPTRVRLPDEPLMLVDRITAIEGEPLSMTSGRVVTEHDVKPNGWYLDAGRIPTALAVESGQADLFLSGWLGIDRETGGHAVYRLLDAVVTFHRGLPVPGDVIRYDIRILQFFRQGNTWLFRFEFDGTVNGEPVLTMRDGCAGFFTAEALAGGKGILHTTLDRQPRPGIVPADWREPVTVTPGTMSNAQVDALRQGDLVAAFGDAFANLPLQKPLTIPGGKLRLVDRVLEIEPGGGKYGLGRIKAEMDIHPDDWFLTCHFCDDHVMPGTLMYECCLHTLRIWLLRMGWIGEADSIVSEPVAGVASKLKCRGQVIESTKTVWYEVTIRELGYRPDAYCIADALMYADGRPIVEITNMSLQFTGLSKEDVDNLWTAARAQSMIPAQLPVYDRRPAIYDLARITAFAIGKPSDAFGDRYRPFDNDRKIARLPGPPFQFLDRVVEVQGEPWVLKAGCGCTAQYDVPPDAWYFAANEQPTMPFSVLLETALQPCGWLAAYAGSALTSETDIKFRNLGGRALQHRDVTPDSGTLTTKVQMTQVSMSGGMIIQHYSMEMTCNDEPVYTGTTYFGFFSKESLANQVGIRDAKRVPPQNEARLTKPLAYPTALPFPKKDYRFIDRLTSLATTGGPHGAGFIRGEANVDPSAWYYAAHFYEDPVMPGSLGLEAFVQLLKRYAAERWGGNLSHFECPANGEAHEWTYRGQVIPKDRLVTVDAEIVSVDDSRRSLVANGWLEVDGRVIYRMQKFVLIAR